MIWQQILKMQYSNDLLNSSVSLVVGLCIGLGKEFTSTIISIINLHGVPIFSLCRILWSWVMSINFLEESRILPFDRQTVPLLALN